MKIYKQIFICFLGVLISLAGKSLLAQDAYPSKEIRIIIGSGAGGSVDRSARAAQRFLPNILGVSVLAENRKGAGGKTGYNYFSKLPPDGYSIYCFTQPSLTNMIKKNPGIMEIDDLAYINVNWSDPTILVARKELGWESLDDLVNAAKKEPGKYSFAASAALSGGTVMAKMLFKKLGLDIKIVPYDGSGSARASLRGGHTDLTAGGSSGAVSIQDAVFPIGVFWNKPIASWPDVLTMNEQLKKYDMRLPNSGSYRFFAVQKEFKEKYPDRWNTLVSAFKKMTTEDKGYQEFCDKGEIGRDWLGPEASTELVKEAHETFMNIEL